MQAAETSPGTPVKSNPTAGKIQAILDKSMALTIIRPDNAPGESPKFHRAGKRISMRKEI
jgi:hypothetical protein